MNYPLNSLPWRQQQGSPVLNGRAAIRGKRAGAWDHTWKRVFGRTAEPTADCASTRNKCLHGKPLRYQDLLVPAAQSNLS